jgi:hypothetical protein
MNIKNAMCKLSELTSEQIYILRNAMPTGQYTFFTTENVIGVTPKGKWGTWDVRGLERNIVTYTEMMQLLGKTMQFTKSDLKTGMFVKHRDGDYAVVLDNDLSGLEHYVSLDTITPKLISSCLTDNDIMFVYVKAERCCMNSHLSGLGLRRVWERTEQTPAQKEMEVLQAKMDELQEQMKVVQAKL